MICDSILQGDLVTEPPFFRRPALAEPLAHDCVRHTHTEYAQQRYPHQLTKHTVEVVWDPSCSRFVVIDVEVEVRPGQTCSISPAVRLPKKADIYDLAYFWNAGLVAVRDAPWTPRYLCEVMAYHPDSSTPDGFVAATAAAVRAVRVKLDRSPYTIANHRRDE